jgi:hypothetical protein
VARVGVEGPPTFTVAEAAERLVVPRRKLRGMIDGEARLTRGEVECLGRELAGRPPTPRRFRAPAAPGNPIHPTA